MDRNLPLQVMDIISSFLRTFSAFCRIQPVCVVDVASAIVSALKDDGTSMGKIYELGEPEVFTTHELVNSLPHRPSCCIYMI